MLFSLHCLSLCCSPEQRLSGRQINEQKQVTKISVDIRIGVYWRRRIYAPVAVVGRWPHSEHRLVEVPLIALHDQLVRSTDHVDVVGGVELGHHVAPEQVAGTSGTHAPPCGVWGRREERSGEHLRLVSPSLNRFFEHSETIRHLRRLDRMRAYLQGRTTGGRTWARRGGLPVSCQWSESGPVSGWRGTSRRAHRRSEGQREEGVESKLTGSYSTGNNIFIVFRVQGNTAQCVSPCHRW